MASQRHKPPTDTKTYLKELIEDTSAWLNDERLASLPTESERRHIEYNGDHMKICKDLDRFINGAGNELRKVQREGRNQALLEGATRKVPSKLEKLERALESVAEHLESSANDLLRQGNSVHVVKLQRGMQTVRDEAISLTALLVVEETEDEMAKSSRSRDGAPVEVHEQSVLEAAETSQQVRTSETEMAQTKRPQTPLVSRNPKRQLVLSPGLEPRPSKRPSHPKLDELNSLGDSE